VVTGPNMAGKSTLMRQVALAHVLAQAGSYVPAAQAELSVCDRIFSRIGASDDLAQGRSTFMVEMTETSHILRGATPHALVLLDEIGRGTSTYDGLSIAWAVAEHIHNVTRCRTLFATHYHELVRLADTLARVQNVHMVVTEFNGEIVFVRTVQEGAAGKSYGIEVARLAGVPHSVLLRAKEVLAHLEGGEQPTAKASTLLPQASPAAPSPQMALFAPSASHPVLDRLRALDVLRMTPLEAMTALASMVEELKKQG
jgi:DNA mismatch repair protein MutS